jgi:GT2 family glycosyltransferase
MAHASPPEVSVVIPAYNNRPLLERFLPPLLAALCRYQAATEIVVADDASTDGSAAFLREAYPEITVVRSERNLGFPGACNLGAAQARYAAILFLNSDVEVDQNFLAPLAEALTAPEVFAAAPAVFDMGAAGEETPRCESLASVRFARGVFEIEPLWNEPLPQEPQCVLYAPAAALLVWKQGFEQLGGFDTLFAPYSWEDVDLCYRAWRTGWRVMVTPDSRVKHYRSSTVLRVFQAGRRAVVTHRNQLLMVWKNVSDPALLVANVLHLPVHLAAALVRGRWWYLSALVAALGRLPMALRRRRGGQKRVLSDREALRLASRPSPLARQRR